MIEYNIEFHEAFTLEAGGCLPDLKLRYHTSLDIRDKGNLEGRRVIWICHALTASSDPSDWWSDLVGESKFFDTAKDLIICVNVIGSCYGSSSPVSINPETNKEYLLSFPKITVRDVAKSFELLRKYLGLTHIDVLIGASNGGFHALEWAEILGDKLKNLVLIATNARCSAWMNAFNESQRMALYADETFLNQSSPEGGKHGLETARSIALLSYRSGDAYNKTQIDEEDCLFAERAASYQRYQGVKLSSRFDAYSYNTLTYMVDSHNFGRQRGGLEKALANLKTYTIVVGIKSDILFPVGELKAMQKYLPNSVYTEISSEFGHDGFLLEYKQISKILSDLCKY